MISALVGEAVVAAKVADVADMYAQRLHLVRLYGIGLRLRRAQKALSFERFDVCRNRLYVLFRQDRLFAALGGGK